MKHLEVSYAVRPLKWSLGVKWLTNHLDALISQIYFGMKIYMFREVPLSIIRNLFTVHSAIVYVIQVCRQFSSRTGMELQFHLVPARKLSTNLYDIYHC